MATTALATAHGGAGHRGSALNGAGPSAAAASSSGDSATLSECKLLRGCPSLFMFMFRSRRNALVKRLWRLAAGRAATDSEDESDAGARGQVKPAAHALFKRLSDDQLALLADCLDGAAASPCLWLDSDLVNGTNWPLPPSRPPSLTVLLSLSLSSRSFRDEPGRRPPPAVPHLPLAGSRRPGRAQAHRQPVHRAGHPVVRRLLQPAPLVAPIT